MQEAQTWRELLASIIRDNKTKQRLIDELHITPITLTRWINGDSEPRPQNLRHLMKALPQFREQFRALLKDEKGLRDVTAPASEEEMKEIATDFYASILTACATTTKALRLWSTSQMIIERALAQLDPDKQGMSIWVARCMPPSGPYNKVRSLRESVGLGTGPWAGPQNALFLGAESMAGNVVTLCRPNTIQDTEQEPYMSPRARVEFEKSATIHPILYSGKVAGVLIASSAQKNYFLAQSRRDLVQKYAELVALAFDTNEFYTPEQIAMCVMPSAEEQQTHFAGFRQLVADTMRQAAYHNKPINNLEADMLVWQKLEEELLKIPVLKGMQ